MSSAIHRRPQLTFDELQQLKWLLGGALTLLGVSTVFYMDVDAWMLMTITSIATIATMFWPTLPARVPALAHTLAFPAIVAFFAADLWLKSEVLPAMVRLDMLLLLYRNISYRQRRDDLQIIVLGLFLVVVAGVLTVSLTFAAQLLVYTACALALLLVVTLTDAASAAGRGPVPFGETPGWAAHADWPHLFRRLRAATDWRVIALGAVLFIGVVGVSALLFLAIPRFQLENSMFLDRLISKKAKSGFSDSIRIGDVTEIQQDNSLALSVDVSDQTQIPAAPYWRMLVLDYYGNGTFKFSAGLRQQALSDERSASYITGDATPRRGAPVYWTFFLESGVSRYLPLLGRFDGLRFRESQNFRIGRTLAMIELRGEPVTMTAYRVEGFELGNTLPDARFSQRWRDRPDDRLNSNVFQTRLNLTPPDEELLERALTAATNDAKLPAPEFARRVSEWLKNNHQYSLSPNIPRGDSDPLVRWLMSREAGHCELFAGSFVLMARKAGFPARVITGFRGGTWNGYSNNFTIRNSDAHAWAEIFDEQAGAWLRADPLAVAATTATDEVKGEAAIVSRLDRSWKARIDSLRVFWYRRIVSFDERSQMETLKAVKEVTQNSGKQLREALARMAASVRAWMSAPWDVRRISVVAGAVAVLAGGAWLWRSFGRAWWRGVMSRRGALRDDPVRREAGWWLRRIAESGHRIPETIAATAELQRLRFGARATWSEPEKVFRCARHALREARRQARATPT